MSSSLATTPVAERRASVRRQVSAWIPVLVCLVVIATESTAFFGADHTSGPLRRLVEFFFGPIQDSVWSYVHMIIRKCGHFTGYGLLSLAWFRAFWMTWRLGEDPNRRRIAAHSLAMAGTLIVASCDEFHQTLLPNRTGTPYDVLLDCGGGLVIQLLVWLWMQRSNQA
jgi:VanZ family protein